MNSFKATAQSRAGAGFQDIKAGTGNLLRVALNRSRLCLLLLLLSAPQAMAAAPNACQDGAKAVIDGTVTTYIYYDTGTYLYIDAPSWNCSPLYIVVNDAGICNAHSTIHAEGTLSQPKDHSDYQGWSLSDGAGSQFASSFSCK